MFRTRRPNPSGRFRRWWAALLAAVGVAHGQMHHVDAPEQVTRAVGVFEWTGELSKPTASRLVPVSLFIDGRLEDAGLYLSRPVPFALQSGDVYSVERAGEPEGLLNLAGAERMSTSGSSVDVAAEPVWYGVGEFKPNAAAKQPVLRASRRVGTITTTEGLGSNSGAAGHPTLGDRTGKASGSSDGDAPTLSRRDGGAADPTKSSPAPATGPASTTTSSSEKSGEPTLGGGAQGKSPEAKAGTAGDDPEEPVLLRRQPGGTASSESSDSGGDLGKTAGEAGENKPSLGRRSSDTSSGGGSDDTDRPTLRKRDPSQDASRTKTKNSGGKGQSNVTAAGPQLGDDPDRPTLHRSTAGKKEGTAALEGMPADLHQAVAVSDATHREAHPFALEWEAGQRAVMLERLQTAARQRVAAYLLTNRLVASAGPIPAPAAKAARAGAAASGEEGVPPKLVRGKPSEYQKPVAAVPPAPVAKPAAKAATKTAAPAAVPGPVVLQEEEMHGFRLSYGGQPMVVYTAEVATGGAVVYVTLVAEQLPTGELQVSLGSVTDAGHLDRVPWLRLVDAVDVDGSHRASLLFELRGEHARQFALYRLTGAEAEQTFATGLLQ